MEPPQKDNGEKKMWNCSLRIEVPPPRAGQNAMEFDGWGFGKWSFTAASLGWAVAEQEKLPWASGTRGGSKMKQILEKWKTGISWD